MNCCETTDYRVLARRLAQGAAIAGVVALLWSQTRMDGLLSQEYVPTESEIRTFYSDFLTDGARELTGIYGYIDIDAILFRYAIPQEIGEDADVLSGVATALLTGGWEVDQPSTDGLHASRLLRQRSRGYGYEESRVILQRDAGLVYVGYFQADLRNSASIENDSEVSWGRTMLLPRLEEIAASLGTEFY